MNKEAASGGSRTLSNGVHVNGAIDHGVDKFLSSVKALQNAPVESQYDARQTNGISLADMNITGNTTKEDGAQTRPPILQHLEEGFLSLPKLVQRRAQQCWNELSDVVEKLAAINLPPRENVQNGSHSRNQLPNGVSSGDQSKENLEKKDRLMKFAEAQMADFIKLLVLTGWSKHANETRKNIDLQYWINQQRILYYAAADEMGRIKRDMALAQVPNPDIETALGILSTQRAAGLSDLGYSLQKPMTPKRTLKVLRNLNNILCSRLAIQEKVPQPFHTFQVHDGRVTFTVPSEFEVDLSVASEDLSTPFYFIDFRFTFSPSSCIPTGRLHDDLARKADDILAKQGLSACYDFLHELTLSYKISALYKQALSLVRGHWSENLRVELIHRTLVVQYWINRPAGKSWLEIGVKKDRRKSSAGLIEHQYTQLHLRWLREGKEVDNPEIEFDLGLLSLDRILNQVVALHTSYILDATYERLLQNPAYNSGRFSLDLSTSGFEPNECSLQVQLTKAKHLTVTVQSVSGAVTFKPASALHARVDYDLYRAKNLIEEVHQKITYIRVVTSEQLVVGYAVSTGWEVSRVLKLTQPEIKTLFSGQSLRPVFLRRPKWSPGWAMAATQGPAGDQYWLVFTGESIGDIPYPLRSEVLGSQDSTSYSSGVYQHFVHLARHCSSIITLRANLAYLNSLSIPCVLTPIPQLEDERETPKLSFQFQPAKLREILSARSRPTDCSEEIFNLHNSLSEPKSRIRQTLTISFGGLNNDTGDAITVVKGRSHASSGVLGYLQTSAPNDFIRIDRTTGDFTIRLQSLVGQPIIELLLDQLFKLETLLACVSTAQSVGTLAVKSLSLSEAYFTYHKGSLFDLDVRIVFATPTHPLTLTFFPEDSNPHTRIVSQLTRFLSAPQRSFSSALPSFLPLLTFTLPLLTLLNDLQTRPSKDTPLLTPEPSLHILPRTPKMYGLQYFLPRPHNQPNPTTSGASSIPSSMLARFEILAHQRRGNLYWLLRPAIEEFESYNGASYCSAKLEARIKAEVFEVRDQGWEGLGSGAACVVGGGHESAIENLVRRVDEVVREWFRGQRSERVEGQKQDPPAGGAGAPVPKQDQPTTNGGANPLRSQNAKASGKAGAPAGKMGGNKGREIIMLD